MTENTDQSKRYSLKINPQTILSKFNSKDKNKILEILDANDSNLIASLEIEMLSDICSIDVKKNDEKNLTIEKVNEWYSGTEKTIRVIGNLFSSPMHQSINQLRYAGHHVLKFYVSDNKENNAELVEAFKHCKRSLYDTMDYYIYRMTAIFKAVFAYLDGDELVKLERSFQDFLTKVAKFRDINDYRIDYYHDINNTLIDGLKLIEKLNIIQRKSGITQEVYKQKHELVQDLIAIKNDNIRMDLELSNLRSKKAQIWSYFSMFLIFAGILGAILAKKNIVSEHVLHFSTTEVEELLLKEQSNIDELKVNNKDQTD